jgi:hypothetical protein
VSSDSAFGEKPVTGTPPLVPTPGTPPLVPTPVAGTVAVVEVAAGALGSVPCACASALANELDPGVVVLAALCVVLEAAWGVKAVWSAAI